MNSDIDTDILDESDRVNSYLNDKLIKNDPILFSTRINEQAKFKLKGKPISLVFTNIPSY